MCRRADHMMKMTDLKYQYFYINKVLLLNLYFWPNNSLATTIKSFSYLLNSVLSHSCNNGGIQWKSELMTSLEIHYFLIKSLPLAMLWNFLAPAEYITHFRKQPQIYKWVYCWLC